MCDRCRAFGEPERILHLQKLKLIARLQSELVATAAACLHNSVSTNKGVR